MNSSISGHGYKLLKILDTKILICDGAMGTELLSRGFSGYPDSANLEQAGIEKIIDIHLSYLDAGSNIIQTNTFGANLEKLKSYSLDSKITDINKNAASAARQAIKNHESTKNSPGPHFVAGDIGPLGKLLEPSGTLKYGQAVDSFLRQTEVLVESGVDLLLIETIMNINEALAAVEAARRSSGDIPLACTLSFGKNGITLMGNKAEDAVKALLDSGCDIVGANCSIGSDSMLEVVRKMRDADPGARLIFQPNAGLPVLKEGKTFYNETPEIMASNMKKYLEYKPSIIGACCGSTPAHISSIIDIISDVSSK
ncbi:Bifunctional homocysteine S-methyltransferase/5,10-methylenetetrahydrofolate reductase [subsurface metagenome]